MAEEVMEQKTCEACKCLFTPPRKKPRQRTCSRECGRQGAGMHSREPTKEEVERSVNKLASMAIDMAALDYSRAGSKEALRIADTYLERARLAISLKGKQCN